MRSVRHTLTRRWPIESWLAAVSIALVALAQLTPLQAYGVEVAPPSTASVPCAILDDFDGQVEILDPARTHLLPSQLKSGIPCQGWVSVVSGWVTIRHRQGYAIHGANGAFFQVGEASPHVVLYRGEIFGNTQAGNGELAILTANAQVRIPDGSAIVVYSQAEENTQVIATEKLAYLENRFEEEARMTVKAGEASSLNFKAMRTVPDIPRAVSLAALKEKAATLNLKSGTVELALGHASRRVDRKLASDLTSTERSIASEGKAAPKRKLPKKLARAYMRHAPMKDDAKLQEHLVNRVVAGQEAGEKILFPDRFYGRPQKVKVLVEQHSFKASKEELAEKSRLIEELQRIRIQ